MTVSLRARRIAYRAAYQLLRVWWWLRRPEIDGVKCLVTDGGRVLLVEHTYGPRRWDLPGGRVERGEAPLAAARREMREELGLCDADWRPLGRLEVRVDHRRDRLHAFTCALEGRRLTIERSELRSADWFKPDRLPAPIAEQAAELIARLGH